MNLFEDFCYTFVSKCTRYLRSERTQLSKMTQEMLKINDSRIFLLYSKDISGTFCVSWGFFLSIKIVTFLTNVIQLLYFIQQTNRFTNLQVFTPLVTQGLNITLGKISHYIFCEEKRTMPGPMILSSGFPSNRRKGW